VLLDQGVPPLAGLRGEQFERPSHERVVGKALDTIGVCRLELDAVR
jgi:hypothetical protein